MNEPNQDQQLDALFSLARQHRPDTSSSEFAFETRLMARIRETRSPASIWAMVSWRLAPIFALFLIALTLWYAQTASATTDAEQIAYVENTGTVDSGANLN